MARSKQRANGANNGAATVGYEAQLWQMADALRGSMDADMSGVSLRSLSYMRDFASAWPEPEIVQRLLPDLPWGQNVVLLDKERDQQARLWYASQCAEHGWSRSVLAPQIEHLN